MLSIKNLYVGNLQWKTTEDDLKELFSHYGTVNSATIIMDRETGRSKGFGFVEMNSNEEADEAVKNLNEKELGGRNLKINEARQRPNRGSFA